MYYDDFNFESEDIPIECSDCKFCEGFSGDDGIPICEYEDGYECCPFCERGKCEVDNVADEQPKASLTVNIDLEDMQGRIILAFRNTIDSAVKSEIATIVRAQFEKEINEKTTQVIEEKIRDCVNISFSQNVTIGGGWGSEPETMTREEYLTKTVGDKLEKDFEHEVMKKVITNEVDYQISKFAENTRANVNREIKNIFDQAMQQNLTNSILNVLMQNETYQKLSASADKLIATEN